MFYVISGGLKLQISMLLLSPISKFRHLKQKWMLLLQQVVSIRCVAEVKDSFKKHVSNNKNVSNTFVCQLHYI